MFTSRFLSPTRRVRPPFPSSRNWPQRPCSSTSPPFSLCEQVQKSRCRSQPERSLYRFGLRRTHRRHRRGSYAGNAQRVGKFSPASPRPNYSGRACAKCSIFSRPSKAAATSCTVQHDILAKAAKLLGMDLTALSLDTVKMFANDANQAGYRL